MCEVDPNVLTHARIVVDQRAAALTEAGDLLQALDAGLISGPESWSELGEVLAGKRPSRQSESEVTVFKSVGLGVQDTAIALHVYNRARKLQVGSEVEV
jgi:ornithine cyclodeaminase/alanine dehydrogenase-like protein (mu-crystallin family)